MSGPPRLDDLLRAARRRLADAGVATPALDARVLAAEAFALAPVRLMTEGDRVPDAAAAARFAAFVARRAAGEPVGRILGRREFHGLDFALGPDTLEPRPETEVLVETALAAVRSGAVPEAGPDGAGLLLVDAGTGTGAVAVSLLVALPAARGIAVDLAPDAARVAAANAARHGVADRLDVRVGSWLDPVTERPALIVSNPPYIESAAIGGLQPEVRDHDPRLALDGGPDGLDPYRALAPAAARLLCPGGTFAVEIGSTQAADVGAILARAGFAPQGAIRDLAGRDRVVAGRLVTPPIV